jgi:hypothetical protein
MTIIVIYKAVTRDTDDPSFSVAGIFLGGLLAIIQALMFWADAWYWNFIGFAISVFDAVLAYALLKEANPRWKNSPDQKTPFSDIEFDYRDASGNATHRRVEVHSIDDEYFEGFCHKAMDIRTFVIGRVRGKVLDRDTGELLPPKNWADSVRNDPCNSGVVVNRR